MDFTDIIGAGFDLLIQPVLVFIPERRVAHKEDVQNYTWKSEDVPLTVGVDALPTTQKQK